MRRLALIALLAVVAVGCARPGEKVVTPTPSTIEGEAPAVPAEVKGDATAGKKAFVDNGCGGCHTFAPAGTKGTVGPDLDKLAESAKADGQPLEGFVHESIVDPNAYVQKGYAPGIMPGTYGSSLSAQQLADLVAFLTQPA